jgi:hypothetical protein
MDSPRFERYARPAVLVLLYAVAAGLIICVLWLAGAFVEAALCGLVGVWCPEWAQPPLFG